MRKLTMLLIITFAICVCVGFTSIQAKADTAKWRITSYITKVEALPIGDKEGHIVLLYERRGVAVFEDGRVAAYHTCGTGDLIKGNGPFQGYTKLSFKDGSTTMLKYQGNLKSHEGGKLPTMEGSGEYIMGTGKLKGIKGTASFTGYYVTPFGEETKGDVVVNAVGNYKLVAQ